MSFTSTAYYRNFSVQDLPQTIPAPVQVLNQIPVQNDLGTALTGNLTAGDLLVGSLYFGTEQTSGSAFGTWTLPSGDSMMKTFGKNLNKFCGVGSIVRVEVVNYGTTGVNIQAGVGSQPVNSRTTKLFTGGNGTGICECLNIKFTSTTGSYIIF
jgi:hypothetical protein